MFKVQLCIPPDYERNFPPLGTPALAAFLKSHGVAVGQRDLNMAYRGFILDRVEGPALPLGARKLLLRTLTKKFFRENLRGRYYSRHLQRTRESHLPELPYDNNTNSSFQFTERLLNSPQLRRYLTDARENTFLQFYRTAAVLDRVRKEGVSLLGLSVTSPSQAIPSLTLGLMVKKALPKVHVAFGGQWVTLFRRQLLARKDLFECFDSLIVFDGETPLLDLARSLRDNKRGPILQVLTKESGVEDCDRFKDEDLDLLPCPDFDGLPLGEYDDWSPAGPALTCETSRGCYWSKCAYCVDLPLPRPSYRFRSPGRVARDFSGLKERYGARLLMLGDPGMSPKQMRGVSEAILKKGVKMDWWCMARMDGGFDRSLFETARKAGLTAVNFGFESASDRVCDGVHKGNRVERSSRVIKDCHAAGIAVNLQTMLGLPGETWEEGLKTVDFLVRHRDCVADATFNIFYLTPSNLVFLAPEKYGLTVPKKKILPFMFFLPFRNERGISGREADLLQKLHRSLVERKTSASAVPCRDDLSFLPQVSLAEGVAREELTLRLNGETSSLGYLRKLDNGDLCLLDDACREVLASARRTGGLKAAGLRALRRRWLRRWGREARELMTASVADAVEKGFLRHV